MITFADIVMFKKMFEIYFFIGICTFHRKSLKKGESLHLYLKLSDSYGHKHVFELSPPDYLSSTAENFWG